MSTEHAQTPEKYSRQKLNAMYRAIPMKDTTFRLLRKYFTAMSVLYGVIPLRKAKEIIRSQNPNLVTDEAFLAFAEIAAHEREEYTIMGDDEIYLNQPKPQPLDRRIIHLSLFGTVPDDAKAADSAPNDVLPLTAITMHQHGKPYYIPPKKEFLTYETILNVLNPTSKAALLDFLQKRCGMGEWEAFFRDDRPDPPHSNRVAAHQSNRAGSRRDRHPAPNRARRQSIHGGFPVVLQRNADDVQPRLHPGRAEPNSAAAKTGAMTAAR